LKGQLIDTQSIYPTVFLELVLGFKVARDLSRFEVRISASTELDASICLGLDVQFQQTKMIAFAKYVLSILSKISIEWWRHDELTKIEKKILNERENAGELKPLDMPYLALIRNYQKLILK
jgi:hypothetical protein